MPAVGLSADWSLTLAVTDERDQHRVGIDAQVQVRDAALGGCETAQSARTSMGGGSRGPWVRETGVCGLGRGWGPKMRPVQAGASWVGRGSAPLMLCLKVGCLASVAGGPAPLDTSKKYKSSEGSVLPMLGKVLYPKNAPATIQLPLMAICIARMARGEKNRK